MEVVAGVVMDSSLLIPILSQQPDSQDILRDSGIDRSLESVLICANALQ